AATGSAVYLIAFGAACALAGVIASLIWRPAPWTAEGLGFAATSGACFAFGTGLISFTLFAYGVPVAKLLSHPWVKASPWAKAGRTCG
ncbi:hypothetical protein ACC699_38690, partial [Rhizobium ruizarguesonis]